MSFINKIDLFSNNHYDIDAEIFKDDVRTSDETLATIIVISLVGMLWLFSIYRLYRVWSLKLNFDGVSCNKSIKHENIFLNFNCGKSFWKKIFFRLHKIIVVGILYLIGCKKSCLKTLL